MEPEDPGNRMKMEDSPIFASVERDLGVTYDDIAPTSDGRDLTPARLAPPGDARRRDEPRSNAGGEPGLTPATDEEV